MTTNPFEDDSIVLEALRGFHPSTTWACLDDDSSIVVDWDTLVVTPPANVAQSPQRQRFRLVSTISSRGMDGALSEIGACERAGSPANDAGFAALDFNETAGDGAANRKTANMEVEMAGSKSRGNAGMVVDSRGNARVGGPGDVASKYGNERFVGSGDGTMSVTRGSERLVGSSDGVMSTTRGNERLVDLGDGAMSMPRANERLVGSGNEAMSMPRANERLIASGDGAMRTTRGNERLGGSMDTGNARAVGFNDVASKSGNERGSMDLAKGTTRGNERVGGLGNVAVTSGNGGFVGSATMGTTFFVDERAGSANNSPNIRTSAVAQFNESGNESVGGGVVKYAFNKGCGKAGPVNSAKHASSSTDRTSTKTTTGSVSVRNHSSASSASSMKATTTTDQFASTATIQALDHAYVQAFGGSVASMSSSMPSSSTPPFNPLSEAYLQTLDLSTSLITTTTTYPTLMMTPKTTSEMLWQCPICLEIPKLHVLESSCCGQTFCEECVLATMRVTDNTCPLCRGAPQWKQNVSVESMLADLPRSCLWCAKLGPREEIRLHEKECPASKSSTVLSPPPPRPPRNAFPLKNPPLAGAAAPAVSTDQWSCPQCTLLNSKHWLSCDACGYADDSTAMAVALAADDPTHRPSSPKRPVRHTVSGSALGGPHTPPIVPPTPPVVPPRTRSSGGVVTSPGPSPSHANAQLSSPSSPGLHAVSVIRCPNCRLALQIPPMASPDSIFKCGGCNKPMRLPANMVTNSYDAVSPIHRRPAPDVPTVQGDILLRVSPNTLLRKGKWRCVIWRLDGYGTLTFHDPKHDDAFLRMVLVSPFQTFTEISEKKTLVQSYYSAKLVENPRSAVTASQVTMRMGKFNPTLPVKDILEIASEAKPDMLVRFVEAVERVIKAKRTVLC